MSSDGSIVPLVFCCSLLVVWVPIDVDPTGTMTYVTNLINAISTAQNINRNINTPILDGDCTFPGGSCDLLPPIAGGGSISTANVFVVTEERSILIKKCISTFFC